MIKYKIAAFLVAFSLAGCGSNLNRLRDRTDINLNIPVGAVSLLREKDLDQIGFELNLNEDQDRKFISELERVSGMKCVDYVISNGGCAYRSLAGHDVFVSRYGLFKYQIRTSG